MRKPVKNRNNKHSGLTGNHLQYGTCALTDIKKYVVEKRIYDKISYLCRRLRLDRRNARGR